MKESKFMTKIKNTMNQHVGDVVQVHSDQWFVVNKDLYVPGQRPLVLDKMIAREKLRAIDNREYKPSFPEYVEIVCTLCDPCK